MGITARLRRKSIDSGTVGADNGCAVQQTGAEYEEIIGRKGIRFWRNPVPQYLRGSTLPPQIVPG